MINNLRYHDKVDYLNQENQDYEDKNEEIVERKQFEKEENEAHITDLKKAIDDSQLVKTDLETEL